MMDLLDAGPDEAAESGLIRNLMHQGKKAEAGRELDQALIRFPQNKQLQELQTKAEVRQNQTGAERSRLRKTHRAANGNYGLPYGSEITPGVQPKVWTMSLHEAWLSRFVCKSEPCGRPPSPKAMSSGVPMICGSGQCVALLVTGGVVQCVLPMEQSRTV